LKAKQ